MAKFNLQDYETVQERLKRFLDTYKGCRVITELMSDPHNTGIAVFRASLYVVPEECEEEILVATGWAFERAGEGFVNEHCHLENAETSAIGRALANMGIHGDKRPSREEMEKVERWAKAEKDHPKAEHFGDKDSGYDEEPKYINALQRKELEKLLKKVDYYKFMTWLKDTYKATTLNDIKFKDYKFILQYVDKVVAKKEER
jgi:hypothetical protein